MSGAICLSVGRSKDNTICMGEADATISRQHAEIVLAQNGSVLLVDCNSTCGTFIHQPDGWQKITQQVVGRGDTIRLGNDQTVLQVSELLRMGGY